MNLTSILHNRDMYIHTMSFIGYDKNIIPLLLSSKTLASICKSYGILTTLQTTFSDNILDFLRLFNENQYTLQKVTMIGIENPFIWLPKFTKIVNFEHTETPSQIINFFNRDIPTEDFTFTDYDRQKHKKTLRINWSKLKNLKRLHLIVWDVDLTGLDTEQLDFYHINTCRNKLIKKKISKYK